MKTYLGKDRKTGEVYVTWADSFSAALANFAKVGSEFNVVCLNDFFPTTDLAQKVLP